MKWLWNRSKRKPKPIKREFRTVIRTAARPGFAEGLKEIETVLHSLQQAMQEIKKLPKRALPESRERDRQPVPCHRQKNSGSGTCNESKGDCRCCEKNI